jgi:hypothetical protein
VDAALDAALLRVSAGEQQQREAVHLPCTQPEPPPGTPGSVLGASTVAVWGSTVSVGVSVGVSGGRLGGGACVSGGGSGSGAGVLGPGMGVMVTGAVLAGGGTGAR